MIQYTNIDRNNNLVYDKQDKVYEKEDLIKKFENFLSVGGFIVKKWINNKRVPYELLVSNGEKNYRFIVYLKNITGAGWKSKPHIRRVQVTNIRKEDPERYIDPTDQDVLMVLGYYDFDDNPIMVAWDAYKYVMHNTNRSCYVGIGNLQAGYSKGIEITNFAEQKIWVFKAEYFKIFLDSYIKDLKVD